MQGVVIAGKLESTEDRGLVICLTVGIDPVSVDRIGAGIKRVFEGRILTALTRNRVGDVKEVLTKALPSRVGNANDDIKDASTDKLIVVAGRKRKFGVLLIPSIFVVVGGSTENA